VEVPLQIAITIIIIIIYIALQIVVATVLQQPKDYFLFYSYNLSAWAGHIFILRLCFIMSVLTDWLWKAGIIQIPQSSIAPEHF